MRELPVALRLYLLALNLACLAMVLLQAVPLLRDGGLGREPRDILQVAAVLTLLAFAGEYLVLQVNRSVSQNLATPVHIAAILLLPPPLPLLLTFLSSVTSETIRRGSPAYKRAFNVSHPTLTVGLTTALSSQVLSPTHLLQSGRLAAAAPGLALVMLLFYLLDV